MTNYGTAVNPKGETITLSECPECHGIYAGSKDSHDKYSYFHEIATK